MKKRVTIWTDGACLKNPGGAGGWAFITSTGIKGSGGEASTTNNRMEILAAINGLSFVEENDVLIISDSRYLVDSIEKGWLQKWTSNNWKRGKKPVKNKDLWREFLRLSYNRSVWLSWVRGHSGDEMNEACDEMAYLAAIAAQSRPSQRPAQVEV